MLQYEKIRRYPRAPLKTLVKEKSGKGNPFYYSKDICEGGIFLITRQPLLPGTTLHLMFNLPGETFAILANGETVSALTNPDNPGMGVKFTEIGETERKLIRNYVNAILSQQGELNVNYNKKINENIAAGSKSLTIEINAPADLAYRVMCEIENYQRWQNVIEHIAVVERNTDGKIRSIKCSTPILITRKNIELDFLYNENERRIFWHSCGGDFTEVRGHVGFDNAGENRCKMNFFIMINTGIVIPPAVQEKSSEHILPGVLKNFKEYVESIHHTK